MTPDEQEHLLRKFEALLELVMQFDALDSTCVPLSKIIEALETR